MAGYHTAIDQTTAAIERRGKYFRNQILVVVVIVGVITAAAAALRAVSSLWGWLVLVPVCGFFVHADHKLLNEWRSELLQLWTRREIDFAALAQAIRANPALPPATTEGMLATLPASGDLVAEQKVSTPTRQAIAAASLALHRGIADALLLNVIASAVVVAVVLAAIWSRALAPLLGLLALVLLPILKRLMARRRKARCETEVAACRALPGFSEADYNRIRAGLQ